VLIMAVLLAGCVLQGREGASAQVPPPWFTSRSGRQPLNCGQGSPDRSCGPVSQAN